MKRSILSVLTVLVGYFSFLGVFLVATFVSASAEASLRESGTFIPMSCGEVTQDGQAASGLEAVCMGHVQDEIPASTMGAVEFQAADGSSAVYRVTEVSNLLIRLMSGAVRSQVFMVGPNGDQASMKVIRQADGSIQMASGEVGEIAFDVPAFEPVFTIQ
ncbi:MAG: hypothetical protein RBT63_06830 [Bdellovibrionales bacterium]|nr:hypothetical protein [Bdellovibrionales bacterium]